MISDLLRPTPFLFFTLLGIVSFGWVVIGVPVGLVLSFFYLRTKDKDKRLRLKKYIILSFSGILLFGLFYALFYSIFGNK